MAAPPLSRSAPEDAVVDKSSDGAVLAALGYKQTLHRGFVSVPRCQPLSARRTRLMTPPHHHPRPCRLALL